MSNYLLFSVGLFVALLAAVGVITQKNGPREMDQLSGTDPRGRGSRP